MFQRPFKPAEQRAKDLVLHVVANTVSDMSHSASQSTSPWQTVTVGVPLQDAKSRFWWRTTGHALAVLLEKAGYSVEAQYRDLLFYIYYVVPELRPGPNIHGRPQRWESFMTDGEQVPLSLQYFLDQSWAPRSLDEIIITLWQTRLVMSVQRESHS